MIPLDIFDEPSNETPIRIMKSSFKGFLFIIYMTFQISLLIVSATLILNDMNLDIYKALLFIHLYFNIISTLYQAHKITSKAYQDEDQQSYCKKCKINRDEQTHHCKICGYCVIQMDHHCFFIANCVGRDNYRFFFAYLFYSNILCIAVLFTLSDQFIFLYRLQISKLSYSFIKLAYTIFGAFSFYLFTTYMIIVQLYILANDSSLINMKKNQRQKYSKAQFAFSLIKFKLWKKIWKAWRKRSIDFNYLFP